MADAVSMYLDFLRKDRVRDKRMVREALARYEAEPCKSTRMQLRAAEYVSGTSKHAAWAELERLKDEATSKRMHQVKHDLEAYGYSVTW